MVLLDLSIDFVFFNYFFSFSVLIKRQQKRNHYRMLILHRQSLHLLNFDLFSFTLVIVKKNDPDKRFYLNRVNLIVDG